MNGEALEEFQKNLIKYYFYMNDYSYPIKENWLKIIFSK